MKEVNKIRCFFRLDPEEEKALHTRFFPVEPMACICQYFGMLLKADGHVEMIGQPNDKADNWKPFRAEEWTDVVKLYKSDKHIAGLKKDGTVVACGYNNKKQCETGDWRNIKEVYLSEEATIGIDKNGTTHYTYTFQTINTPTPPPAPAQSIPSLVMPAAAVPSPTPAKPPVQPKSSAVSHTTAPAAKQSPSPKNDTPTDPPYPKATHFVWLSHRYNADGSITITEYTGQEKNVVIPRTIYGQTVTHIGARAFYLCSLLTSVTIPDSVKYIGEWAFWGCSSLTSVNIPKNVRTIRNRAFLGCSSLTSLKLPEGIKSIAEATFSDCANLTSLWIPDSVKKIGFGAFINCKKLTLYGNAGSYAQRYAESNKIPFRTTPFPENNAPTDIPPKKKDDKMLFKYTVDADDTVTITKYTGQEKKLILPHTIRGKTVNRIGNRAFSECISLTSVTLPDSITNIGYGAFAGCVGLTAVTIPNSVTNIGWRVFYGCSSLTSVTIPNSVKSIGDRVFAYCKSLTSVTLSHRITSIGNWEFFGCIGLTSVTIPDRITNIGYSAFAGCSNLTSVTIPKSVIHIGTLAFNGCSSLTLYGYHFSYAETYAKENNIPFVVLSV